jgi:hypothetical protein
MALAPRSRREVLRRRPHSKFIFAAPSLDVHRAATAPQRLQAIVAAAQPAAPAMSDGAAGAAGAAGASGSGAAAPTGKSLRSNALVHNKIKRLMQADSDVGKVAKATTVLICACGRWLRAACGGATAPGGPNLNLFEWFTPFLTRAPLLPMTSTLVQPRRWSRS